MLELIKKFLLQEFGYEEEEIALKLERMIEDQIQTDLTASYAEGENYGYGVGYDDGFAAGEDNCD